MCPNDMFLRRFLRLRRTPDSGLFDPLNHALFHVEHRRRLRKHRLLRIQRRGDDLAAQPLHRGHQATDRLPIQFRGWVVEQQ